MGAMTETLECMVPEYEWILPLCMALLGACVGSFLNVVIYRLPLGLSVSTPRRSFCPVCRTPIPWYLNIPIVSWLMLRGKSACCHSPISVRYWLVEVACTLLFGALGWYFSYEPLVALLLLCLWGGGMLALLVMDWEKMVVHVRLSALTACCGLAVAVLDPSLVEPLAVQPWEGALWGLVGAAGGFALFRLVALGGRLFFGRRRQRFAEPAEWQLRQVGEDIVLSAGGQDYRWTEIFTENHCRVVVEQATLAQLPNAHGTLTLEEDALLLPDGTRKSLEEYESLSGTCSGVRVYREAMGSGDAWLAMAIGALCGWQGVVFALVGGSVLGLIFAIITRVRRGVPMPFGPALVLAAYVWLFWGPQLLALYAEMYP